MTQASAPPRTTATATRSSLPTSSRSPDRRLGLFAAVGVVALVAGVAFVLVRDEGDVGQTSDVNAQGDPDSTLATNAAHLVRRADGLTARMDIPTPSPSSYDYPTADLVPGWADAHPPVNPGASDAPEAFTGWLFVFNHPDRCTDGVCDIDDLGTDTAARGGSYQFDGRVGSEDRLVLSGTVRLGQEPANGARLENPVGAEVHVAIAPHGRMLAGEDGWRQLNGPVGSPDFWWAAAFEP